MRLSRREATRLGIPWPEGAKGKPAHVRGQMNRTEARYAEVLEARRLAGEIKGWGFEVESLALGMGARYWPDFKVWLWDGSVEYHEVKQAYARKDASAAGIVKLKWAAQRYSERRFFLCRCRCGEWVVTRVGG